VSPKRHKTPSWDALFDVAASQEGLFTTGQAAEAGYSSQLLYAHMHAGRVRRLRRGVYRLVHFPPGASTPSAGRRYIGEGFDDAWLDTLFLALPISFKGTLVQYTGRLHRLHARKTEVRIFDYVDHSVPMLLKMFENRLRGYRAIGYARDEAPLGFAPPPEEPTIEYDEEALRHFDQDE
jgi:hypothetical protein